MKVLSFVLASLSIALVADASNAHDDLSLASRHARLSARRSELVAKSESSRRCKNRPARVKTTSSTTSSTVVPAKAFIESSTKAVVSSTKAAAKPTTSTTVKAQATKAATSDNTSSIGLLSVKSSCGNIGATKKTTSTSGPNGSIDWLNCGISDGGWKPPFVKVSDLKVVSLSAALQAGGPFTACKSYISIMEKYASQFGIPPILLASFAMQESSCNPETVGGGGEQGLMQITKDKCGGAPGGNCRDPDFNIRTGAKYFAGLLDGNGGDVLTSIASYNGWYPGLTVGKATAARHSSCCRCQNNLDYLHQFLNGWCQNINAYDNSFRLGKYFNLDVC